MATSEAVKHPSYDLLLDRYATAIRRLHAGEGTHEGVIEAKTRLDRFVAKLEKEEEKEEEGPVEIRGFLPRLTPYQKAVIKVAGADALPQLNPGWHTRIEGESEWGHRARIRRATEKRNTPLGQSWHRVRGQRKSNLMNTIRRDHRKWLKKLDKRCRENPSPTFKVNLNKDCLADAECRTGARNEMKGRTMDSVVVQLQLLGVEVTL